ncbi:hypothetical protein ABEB36_005585 [Hypothenemus hampei]|uniref:Transmembrane protein 267 n=1 Tax=Hypothenemus hampei TaxID=57062 RepID=A0ABD1EYQ9_HYPHA
MNLLRLLHNAIIDNVTHALIGGISWTIVCLNGDKGFKKANELLEIICCTILSSIIDLDHFIEARSVLLKNATKLNKRPFLHCSTIPIVLSVVLLLWSYLASYQFLKRFALLVLTAFATHHIRDATRRGLWLWPFGSTPAIPYGIYIGLLCVFPHIMVIADGLIKIDKSQSNIYYSFVI